MEYRVNIPVIETGVGERAATHCAGYSFVDEQKIGP